jgi:dihydrofolate reductase
VVTRQSHWQEAGALRADSLASAMVLCGEAQNVWVIGGAQLYALAEPLAHTAVITEIDTVLEGDAFAPIFGPAWQESAREEHTAANGLQYRFITLNRTGVC